jgi:nitrilase
MVESSPRHVTVAAVQATPVFLDRAATTDKAGALIKEAAAAGASLVVFPETFIPTYPDWVWRLPAWSDGAFVERLYENSVAVPSPTVDQLSAAAAEAGAYVAMGINEMDGGTLYNTLLDLGPDGSLVGRHRKLMPTGGERTVWGMGDGSTLGVVQTPFGVLGGLICWETTCRWPARPCTRRASRSTSRPPGTTPTAGSARCSTSPRRAVAM